MPAERPKKRAVVNVDALGNTVKTEGVEAMFVVKPKMTKEEKKAAAVRRVASRAHFDFV